MQARSRFAPPVALRTAFAAWRPGPVLAALACGLIAAYLALNATDARRVKHANELGASGSYAQAIAVAGKVSSASQRGDAVRVQAYADLALGRDRDAIVAFRQALRHDPQDWVLHRDLASALLLVGARASARVEMGRALALNPKLVLPAGFVRG